MIIPKHEFIVIEEQIPLVDVTWNENRVLINGLEVSPQASIDNELINYFNDSLNWIKSKGPSDSFPGYGLDQYGYTIISDIENLITFKNIIAAWRDLFSNAPTELILTGNYGWKAASEIGHYEKISFNRFELIESLNKLIEVIEMAIESNHCVIHFGV
ncbi:hypothetical protein J2W91_005401 [Paenibacillus amylolyticus]|uniref:DUF1877 family protein n=1 Tax=Paenibacillus amylolyticus TaxID=1451 RepID=A0AAP5LQ15_PAEAM|nr:hypothetical protein [Paenibacillus amylolyticus]MDR6726876.1 hypothetical protein [Paenibacillus amylolyticus]